MKQITYIFQIFTSFFILLIISGCIQLEIDKPENKEIKNLAELVDREITDLEKKAELASSAEKEFNSLSEIPDCKQFLQKYETLAVDYNKLENEAVGNLNKLIELNNKLIESNSPLGMELKNIVSNLKS